VKSPDARKTRIVGRTLRLLVGLALVWLTVDVMLSEDVVFNAKVIGVGLGAAIFYGALHVAINRFTPNVNAWLGAILAVIPVALLYVLGGPLGRVASVAFVGVSLVLQAIRADGGCEVMSLPAMVFGKRTHLVCVAFSPIDWVEERLAHRGFG